jgi:bacitracin synthase 3
VKQPGKKVKELSLLSDQERQGVLCDFNNTDQVFRQDQTLHALFEEQACKTPEAVALWVEERRLTYRELNAQANRLAHYLRDSLGVGPEDFVGIMVNRSEWMIIAILAVLKAGAAYVPVDPRYPANAVRFMLEDAQVKALLLESEYLRNVDGFAGELFFMDMEIDSLSTPEHDAEHMSDGSNLAYVIYTSGSTGQQKGVGVEHQSIVNTLVWRREFYGFKESDVTLQIPSYAFDSSVVDIFSMLTCGGALVILYNRDLGTDLNYIKQLISQHKVTHILVTPTFYKLLIGQLKGVTTLRAVTIAGEAIHDFVVKEHYKHLPGTRLINEYGPTENSVCSTACDLTERDSYVSIGKPIANVKVYLLDGHFNPVPVGVQGEIYLGGRGLARGYLFNSHELTGERFLPDPFSREKGQRMYKTGDCARWMPDGKLEFLGRADDQVKIRGFRIELGEIEHHLLKHPEVKDAVVVCKDDQEGNKRLSAYIVVNKSLKSPELRGYLSHRLPYYMVPEVFVAIAALPLTANGKLDVRALPDADDLRSGDEADYLAPRSAEEERLSAIWLRLLDLKKVSVRDNFFEIGGNSLKAVQLLLEISKECGVDIPLPDLFNAPTVEKLAQRIAVAQVQQAPV